MLSVCSLPAAFFLAVEQALDEVDIPDPSKGCVKPGQ